MNICINQVPYMAGATHDGASDGPRRLLQAGVDRLLDRRGAAVTVERVERPQQFDDQIAVSPNARRAHVGARLYAHAASVARARGVPALVCDINLDPPNPVSLCFHARLGFREVAVIATRDGRTVSLQRKDVSGSGLA